MGQHFWLQYWLVEDVLLAIVGVCNLVLALLAWASACRCDDEQGSRNDHRRRNVDIERTTFAILSDVHRFEPFAGAVYLLIDCMAASG